MSRISPGRSSTYVFTILLLIVIGGTWILSRRSISVAPLATHFDPAKSHVVSLLAPLALREIYSNSITKFFSSKGYSVDWVTNVHEANFQISDVALNSSRPIQTQTQGEHVSLVPGNDMVIPTQIPIRFVSIGDAVLKNSNAIDITQQLAKELALTLQTAKPANTWTVKALGDVIIGRTVYKIMNQKNDWQAAFTKTSDFTKDADLTLADFESVLSDTVDYPTLGMTFSAPKRAAAGLNSAGIMAVNVANNHAYNNGSKAFVDTLSTLKSYNIPYFGGGVDAVEAHSPLIKEVKGVKVALLGYSSIIGTHEAGVNDPGQAYLSMKPWGDFDEKRVQQMETDIHLAKQQADLVFVYYHWGVEYTHDENADQRTVAHRAVDAGADVILGTHPHWVQGVEWYKNKLITYSLGNFVFDQEWSTQTKQGTILSMTFDGKNLIDAKLIPYQIENYYQPHFVDTALGNTILSDVYNHSWW